MPDSVPADARDAFEAHEKFTETAEGFAVESTVFDGFVTASESTDGGYTYTVTVYVPTLDEAVVEEITPAVEASWQETFERRLEDATKATRANVELRAFAVEPVGDELRIDYTFEWGEPRRATEIAKTFVEYVEGTYVEGIIPGYEYDSPVADLLETASHSDDDAPRGGTPL